MIVELFIGNIYYLYTIKGKIILLKNRFILLIIILNYKHFDPLYLTQLE